MKQTGNSAQAARAEMDHAQAELMEILWKKEQAAKKGDLRMIALKIEDLKEKIDYWKNKFQRVVKYIHDKIHGIFGDKDDKYKEMADNLFINGIMDEKEYTSVINKKEKNRDDFER